jgi:hypothetical protein
MWPFAFIDVTDAKCAHVGPGNHESQSVEIHRRDTRGANSTAGSTFPDHRVIYSVARPFKETGGLVTTDRVRCPTSCTYRRAAT